MPTDESIRLEALKIAHERYPNASIKDLLEEASKIETYLTKGEIPNS